MVEMDYGYEGCEHILEALYDFAIENNIPVVRVDDELRQGYWQHQKLYERMNDGSQGALADELRQHQLDVHVLEHHVKSELESMAKKGR